MGRKRQLWLPEFYCKKYGSNILGFTVLNLNLHLNTVISLTDIMLIYQLLKYWNLFCTKSPSQAAFKY